MWWKALLRGRGGRFLLGALDTRCLALETAQIIQPRAAHASLLHHFNRADHRRMERENSLHADGEAYAPHGKRGPGQVAALADYHALKRLNTFLVALAFLQANVHPHCVAGA